MLMHSTQNKNLFAYNLLVNGPIFNLLALLEMSQSSLSLYAIISKQLIQTKEYIYLQCIYNVDAKCLQCTEKY